MKWLLSTFMIINHLKKKKRKKTPVINVYAEHLSPMEHSVTT